MAHTNPQPTSSNARSQWDRNGLSRGIVLALFLSITLHIAAVGTLYVAALLGFDFSLELNESSSIGFMQRAGLAAHGDQTATAPRYTHIADIALPNPPAGPPAPTDEEREAMQAAPRAQEEAAQKEAEAEQAREEQEAQAKADQDQRARERAEKKQNDKEKAATSASKNKGSDTDSTSRNKKNDVTASSSDKSKAATDAAQKDDGDDTHSASSGSHDDADAGGADAGPRLDLPPGERYPEGTINPIATDLSMWGPEGAQLVVVVRNDRLRKSPHASDVRSVLNAFPDWRTLIGGANIDPLTEVDTTVIASSNPKYINQTFIAAMHHIPSKRVLETLSQGDHGGVTWSQKNDRLIGEVKSKRGQDPRQFYIPSDGILIYSQPKFLDDLASGVTAPENAKELLAFAQLSPEEQQRQLETSSDDLTKPKVRRPHQRLPKRDRGWLKGLADIASYGGTERKGLVAMVSTGKISGMRFQGYRGAMPQSMHADIYGDSDVRITGRLIFKSKAEATAFHDSWRDILNANRSSLNLIGLYTPLNEATLAVDHNELTIELNISKRAVHRMSVSISQLMKMR